jgi:hypothetical protein
MPTDQEILTLYAQVKTIIDGTTATPVIVNPESRFVVVTYWWGRGNDNRNTARPCGEFYERTLEDSVMRLVSYPPNVGSYKDALLKDRQFAKFMRGRVEKYLREARDYVRSGKPVVSGYQERTLRDVTVIVLDALFSVVKDCVPHVKTLQTLIVELADLRAAFSEQEANNVVTPEITKKFKQELEALAQRKQTAKGLIKTAIRPAVNALYSKLLYAPPLKYEVMIANWEAACRSAGCNYMAVEYPEFARPGGYQLAINAKPRFIQKALSLCGDRGVLYIDGDMTINHYPAIFDMKDVDMMARGWHVDPRASYKHIDQSLAVDPYVFETSGGTMFFGTTPESQALLNYWIQTSEVPLQFGKADDRLLSLVFNTKRLLLPMKIVQLPVEYLWLTLDYDFSIENIDHDHIFIEHPECLTSEDTATDRGASSSRSPKFYAGWDEVVNRSEFLMERVLFDEPAQIEAFKPYLEYLANATYFPGDDLEGEQPFYVVPYEKGFGKFQATVDANNAAAAALPPLQAIAGSELTIVLTEEGFVSMTAANQERIRHIAAQNRIPELQGGASVSTSTVDVFAPARSTQQLTPTTIIPYILQALDAGVSVRVLPSNSDVQMVERFTKATQAYPRTEFIFVNASQDTRWHQYYQFQIDVNQPIYMKAGCRHLRDLVALCGSWNDMTTIYRDAYQLLSRIRTYFIQLPKTHVGGGDDTTMTAADEAMRIMYQGFGMMGGVVGGGANRKRRSATRRRKQHRRTLKRFRRSH